MNQYGLDVDKLDQLLLTPISEETKWGLFSTIVSQDEFLLRRARINAKKLFPFEGENSKEATIYVEEGIVSIGGVDLKEREFTILGPREKKEITTEEGAVIYIFYGKASDSAQYGSKHGTSDFRDKYWGTIETIVSKNYAAKRMFVKKGSHASLEYHVKKLEAYYVHSGKLLARFRAGRAEDRYFEIGPGSGVLIPPGLMHQRGGLEDTVIIEISTRDEDSDSYLVEDGKKTKMPNLQL